MTPKRRCCCARGAIECCGDGRYVVYYGIRHRQIFRLQKEEKASTILKSPKGQVLRSSIEAAEQENPPTPRNKDLCTAVKLMGTYLHVQHLSENYNQPQLN